MRPELSSETVFIVSRPGGSQVVGRPGGADARGRYRITGLPPGEYLVSVLSFDPTMTKTEVHFTDPAGQDRILSQGSVFYPGVPTVSQASKVTVTEGGEAMGVDMTVRPVPMTQITVTATASRPVREIQLQQILIEEPLPTLETEIWMTGTTVTLDAGPGRYRLLAFAEVALNAETAVRLWASAEVDTDPSIPAAVDMHLEPGANISGRIVFEGTESNRQNAEARLAPVSPLRFVPANKRLPTDGKTIFEAATGIFSIEGILPGRYVIQAGSPAGRPEWTLKAATIAGRDVIDEPIDLRPGEEIENVRLTVTDRVIELSGKIVDDATPTDKHRVGPGVLGRQKTLVARLAADSVGSAGRRWRVHDPGSASRLICRDGRARSGRADGPGKVGGARRHRHARHARGRRTKSAGPAVATEIAHPCDRTSPPGARRAGQRPRVSFYGKRKTKPEVVSGRDDHRSARRCPDISAAAWGDRRCARVPVSKPGDLRISASEPGKTGNSSCAASRRGS